MWEMRICIVAASGESAADHGLLGEEMLRSVEDWGTSKRRFRFVALVDGTAVGAAWYGCFPALRTGLRIREMDSQKMSIAVLMPSRQGIGYAVSGADCFRRRFNVA